MFAPLQLGDIGRCEHRVVLAPLTRNRAEEPSLAPSALAVEYYRQRASRGGLLITEATCISPEALAYPGVPGVWSLEQVRGWRRVTDAVHQKGGLIVCQLWHTGRCAHPSFGAHPSVEPYDAARRAAARAAGRPDPPATRPCVSASSVGIRTRKGAPGMTMTLDGGFGAHAAPRPLSREDIARVCGDYARAARNARAAGFDGVEVHAAHGYLIDQFLNDNINARDDEYGGAPRNRCRFLEEVVRAVAGAVGTAARVGVRLSPHEAPRGGYTYYGARDSNPDAVYAEAVRRLDALRSGPGGARLAYLLLTEPRWTGRHDGDHASDPGFAMPLVNLEKFRGLWRGALIGAGGFTPASSFAAVGEPAGGEPAGGEPAARGGSNAAGSNAAGSNAAGSVGSPARPTEGRGVGPARYDLIAFGRWFISNPDLPERLRRRRDALAAGAPADDALAVPALNRYERSTFYSRGEEGYVDYPSLAFEATEAGRSSEAEGGRCAGPMVVGKYAKVPQHAVGTSLARSKL
jgi:N-ethylmaleimide reductase